MNRTWILYGVLLCIILLLMIKIWYLKKDLAEISTEIKALLSYETNVLISSSSHDKYILEIASQMNKHLQELRIQQHQYQNGNQELKDAVTNISHDLRTPLTAICGYLELLEQEDKSATVERYVQIIQERVQMLEYLIEEFFRYTIVITDEHHTNNKKVVLNKVIEDSIAQFYVMFKERGIIPSIQLPEKKVIRNLNTTALSRVFTNLLNNVVKYSDGDLEVILLETGEITFINTASKLDEVEVAKLFNRFYTVDTAKNATGLGLAIAQTLIDQMKGSISASYIDGKLHIRIQFKDN